jgi:MFS family permease
MPAVRSGFRFARHSPQVLKIVLRGLWFTMGIVGLISLLPLLAAGLGAGSADLGLLLAAQGVGAVVGALSLPRLRRYASANRIVAAGFLSAGCAVLASGLATNLLVLGVAVFVSGWAWTGTLATLTAGMQLYLPAWVRARGIAMLLTSIYAGQAVGAVGLGWIATSVGLTWALEVAAVILIGGALLAMWPLKDLSHVDRSAVFGWSAPELVINPNEIGGQVQVRITYTILKAAEREFLTAMHFLRRVRLRTGATRWQLLKDADANHVFIEEFTVSSWAEYQHQRQDRSVASDLALEHAVAELSVEPASTVYLFRVETM